MRRLKRFASVFLLASLIVSSTAWAESPKQSESEVVTRYDIIQANKFRELVGFAPMDIGKGIPENSFSKESKTQYGVFLTDEELETLERRVSTIKESSKLQEKIVSNTDITDSYGGVYYDHFNENGVLMIGIVDKGRSKEEVFKIVSEFPEQSEIKVFDVMFSLNELQDIQEKVDKLLIEKELEGWSTAVSTQDNKVIIALDKNDRREILDILFRDFDISEKSVEFVEAYNLSGMSRSAYTNPLIGGLQIKNLSTSSSCTGSFTGITSGSGRVYVTAGHCANGLGNSFSQGGSTIGTVVARQHSGNTDALAISIPSYPTSGKIYGDAKLVDFDMSDYINGDIVCKSGVTTGVSCGTVTYGTFSYSQTTSLGTVALYNQFVVSANGGQGDSGAPVYYPNFVSGGQIGSGLTGVLSGGGVIDGKQQFVSSKIKYVFENLGIIGIVVGN